MTVSRYRMIVVACALVLLSGCAALSSLPFFGDKADADKDKGKKEPTTTEQQVYNHAQSALRGANYDEAIKQLTDLDSRFPFGRYADQAQLDVIYAHFMAFEPEEARAAAERFIRLHPEHPRVDYAYYLKGLAAFNKDRGVLDRFLPIPVSRRDPGAARDSFADFNQLVRDHPDSPYAPDARQRMIFLRNLLADSEVEIAHYYIRRGALVAAANRGRYVVENYAQAPAAVDALAVMVEAYARLGQSDLANDALRVLALNYPKYEAFDAKGDFVLRADTRNQDRSWLNLVTIGVLDKPPRGAPLRIRLPSALDGAQTTAQPGMTGFAAPQPALAAPIAPDPEAPAETSTVTPPAKASGWKRFWPF